MAPTVIKGHLNYREPWVLPTVKLFTGNPVLRSDGALVMGAGAAKAVRDRWPGVQYGLRIIPGRRLAWYEIQPSQWIGWFQVKEHWREPAKVSLIKHAAQQLATVAVSHKGQVFELNAPGVGNGGLKWDVVEPLLAGLPSNVHVYLV